MNIYIERNNETIQKDFQGSAAQLLSTLAIIPEDVLIIKNNNLVTEEEELTNEDSIKLLSVISGG